MDYNKIKYRAELEYKRNAIGDFESFIRRENLHKARIDIKHALSTTAIDRKEKSIVLYALFIENILFRVLRHWEYFRIRLDFRDPANAYRIAHLSYFRNTDFTHDRFTPIVDMLEKMLTGSPNGHFIGLCTIELESVNIDEISIPATQFRQRVEKPNNVPQHSKIYDALHTPEILRTEEQEKIIREYESNYREAAMQSIHYYKPTIGYKPIEYPRALMTDEMQEVVDEYNKRAEEKYNRYIELYEEIRKDICNAVASDANKVNGTASGSTNGKSMPVQCLDECGNAADYTEFFYDPNVPKTITVAPAKVNITIEPINTIKLT